MTPRPVDTPQTAFEPALAHAREGRFSDAVRWVEDRVGAADSDPRLADAARTLMHITRLAAQGEDAHAALEAMHLAVRCRRGWADLHLLHALAFLALGCRAEARASLDTALVINPRYAAALLERALLDAREGLIGEALEAVRALPAQVRVSDPRLFEQGVEFLEAADWDAAATRLRRALRIGEPELEQRLERFQALLDLDQPALAAQLLREALPRFEAYPDLHHRIGVAELRQGFLDDAMVSFGRALELNPDFSAARLMMARTLDAAGARPQALDQLGLVLQREPTNVHARALEREWSPPAMRSRARQQSGHEGT
jgi:tetratricopeptide (TPR) repeat protein